MELPQLATSHATHGATCTSPLPPPPMGYSAAPGLPLPGGAGSLPRWRLGTAQDPAAVTPLELAARCGQMRVVALLLQHGADPARITVSWTYLWVGAIYLCVRLRDVWGGGWGTGH